MPTIKRKVSAATDDALNGLKFKTQGSPALVSLYASSATAGESLTFSVGSNSFVESAPMNLEIANEVVDPYRDGILVQEAVPAGEYFLSIPVVAADCSFMLVIEPVPAG